MGMSIIAATIAMTLSMGSPELATTVEWKNDVELKKGQVQLATVHTVDKQKPGVMLQCTGETMSAIFAVEGIDFDTLDDIKTSRSRQWTGKLFIDGVLEDERTWVYLPATKAVWPNFYESIGGIEKLNATLAAIGRDPVSE